jgi:hypothetical protein
MDEVGWASDSKYKYYLYQTTTSLCNTTFVTIYEALEKYIETFYISSPGGLIYG